MAETFEDVKGIIVELLGVDTEKVAKEAKFREDLEADSLDLVELIMAFEEVEEDGFSVVLDERSAAFQALGRIKATGNPVGLICTSGTAGAHYYPAVIEARESGLPLVVITADRPPELRHCHAGQTIDQDKITNFKQDKDPAQDQNKPETWVVGPGGQQ